ncbi:pectin lyase-like protein [Fimicolochytrium jonesii]|uniref:pectin lyase-like protein n=1 Tax=Fimicolochytrium jonesii TaxID=1396493 RepID=UPI0022FE4880|nr:pectin lyase-like protein [Fimicolochytrium jonesii]KAI8823723.1 pectin lyase-like protein [Fimicolochytrium jonesii]
MKGYVRAILAIFIVSCLAIAVQAAAIAPAAPRAAPVTKLAGKICNVLDFGGKADNKTDLGPALLAAYKQCIATNPGSTSTRRPKLIVPKGSYILKTNVLFKHPTPFVFQLDGGIFIPFIPTLGGTLIQFQSCQRITFSGTGYIDGNGTPWRPDVAHLNRYPGRPRLLRFQDCDRCKISGVSLINSPKFHLTVNGNDNEISDMRVVSDVLGETDAFDVSGNNNYVHDVFVRNGDECVTVKTPTTNFRAENIVCESTAGCNIGSFGRDSGTNVQIDGVSYKNVTIYGGAKAGILLKSYPISKGYVRNLHYENIKLTDAAYPISFNTFWCVPGPCMADRGNLRVSNVTFTNVKIDGKTNKPRPMIQLNCLPGAGAGCHDVKITKLDASRATGYKPNVVRNTYNLQIEKSLVRSEYDN